MSERANRSPGTDWHINAVWDKAAAGYQLPLYPARIAASNMALTLGAATSHFKKPKVTT